MIGEIIGALVLVGLAFWFARYVGGDPFGWAWKQIKAGWDRIGK